MSKRYPGGLITKSPVTPAGPYETNAASGVWTLEQQMQFKQQGIWPTAGLTPNYIEDVFSTYLYTGNDTTQTITNGIDLSTNGGMVWIKPRNQVQNHVIFDTVGGITKSLATNNTNAQYTATGGNEGLASFNTTGFTAKLYQDSTGINNSACNLASWTFRKQPKFFDIQTYTGTGVAGKIVTHNLGSVPGCIMVKKTSGAEQWSVYHVGAGSVWTLILDDTSARDVTNNFNYANGLTSTEFQVGSNTPTNQNGATYVAYLFAHNAGGFGLTGTDNVISCGSYTGNASLSGPVVTLGYEPQWVLVKRTDTTGNWQLQDNMRSLSQTNTDILFPNLSNAATTGAYPSVVPTATGFYIGDNGTGYNASGGTYIYIAIRRGPMKVPTLGTSVFSPIAYTGNSTTNTTVQNLTTSFAGDAVIIPQRTGGNNPLFFDKLRGKTQALYTSLTLAEEDINAFRAGQSVGFNNTQTVLTGQYTAQGNYNYSGDAFVGWNFKRAPSFFDEVCYTGTGVARTVAHNLAAVPELMIVKRRSDIRDWNVYASPLGATKFMYLNTQDAVQTDTMWNDTSPTSSLFTVGTYQGVNASASTYVAYLFATCAGVSKVGSYTGNGSTQTIDCGFTGGARFVLIKRTDSTGGWYVYDTARGMTVLTDPYLFLNSTAAESATLGSVTTVSTGFALNSAILAAINVSAGTYIFLAIA